jgi:excisionase family DNA binding protein
MIGRLLESKPRTLPASIGSEGPSPLRKIGKVAHLDKEEEVNRTRTAPEAKSGRMAKLHFATKNPRCTFESLTSAVGTPPPLSASPDRVTAMSSQSDNKPKAFTVKYIAKALQLLPKTVRRMIRRGEIRAPRCGRVYRVPAAELERLTHGQAG